MNYAKFSLTLLISFAIMYCVMFLNVDDFSHIYFSLTRTYMALLMVSPMAVLMMIMMRKMYQDKKINAIVIITSVVVFGLSLAALRNQWGIGDVQYMKAMIPHHSSAILTSKHANIRDTAVKRLSESIIQSQEHEIDEMKQMISHMQ